ncbi:MAG: ribonuclease III [Thermoanaerobacteraceae bacterium]|nr:ribonuclease III [Thermoanaerobacteraceae bacterium]
MQLKITLASVVRMHPWSLRNIQIEWMMDLAEYDVIEKTIRYKFKDKFLLRMALTHSSFANEQKELASNERLEFLGDSVLSLVVTEYIYRQLPEIDEGYLSKLRASLVCEPALAKKARYIRLGNYLKLSHGEELSGGRERSSILADALEALIGAIYLDGGLESAREFIMNFVLDDFDDIYNSSGAFDYKSKLQEFAQKNGYSISYIVTDESGPDHDKTFYVEVIVNNEAMGHGAGKTKKEAEQNSAKEALEKIRII